MAKQIKQTEQQEVKTLIDFANKKSPYIRYLSSEGKSRKEIVNIFKQQGVEIRYQHVRNVLITPLVGKDK